MINAAAWAKFIDILLRYRINKSGVKTYIMYDSSFMKYIEEVNTWRQKIDYSMSREVRMNEGNGCDANEFEIFLGKVLIKHFKIAIFSQICQWAKNSVLYA